MVISRAMYYIFVSSKLEKLVSLYDETAKEEQSPTAIRQAVNHFAK